MDTLRGRARIIFDAKYKVAGPDDRYPNADHYQMPAYCTALRAATAWLVYAGGHHPRTRHVRKAGIDFLEYPLDLSTEPRHPLAQIRHLADTATLTAGLTKSAAV